MKKVSRRSPSIPTPTAAAPHVRAADLAVADRSVPAGRELPLDRATARGRRASRRGRGASRLWLPGRAGRVRRGGRATPGSIFVGPPASAIRAMGDKTEARRRMREADVPVVPGAQEPVARSRGPALALAREIGYPVMVKAAAGGGGKGMRVVREPSELEAALDDRRVGGAQGVRRRQRLPGEAHRAAAPRRDPGARRSRAHRAPGRAGMLDPAPAPEAGRGGALGRGHARAAGVDGRGRGRRGPGGGLPRRRHLRVPARRGRQSSTSSR